jgi:hypothetical protein
MTKVLYAAMEIQPDRVVKVEDDETVDGRDAVAIHFGGDREDADVTLSMPDETAARLLLHLCENAPRLSANVLQQAHSRLVSRMAPTVEEYRRRLDPGPLAGAVPDNP